MSNNQLVKPMTRRDVKINMKRKERLRTDLVSKFGISKIDSIDKNIAGVADHLFSQGQSYLTALDNLSASVLQQPNHLSIDANKGGNDKMEHAHDTEISIPSKKPQEKMKGREFHEKESHHDSYNPTYEGRKSSVCWGDVSAKKDDIDKIERYKERVADREKRNGYRQKHCFNQSIEKNWRNNKNQLLSGTKIKKIKKLTMRKRCLLSKHIILRRR
eukprot:TRINITY_DN13096_c0_g1_i1.p1 TRINITY_DN13096_c0_g1~~TRINITY_DN13096_c0_g1_i1.p1  ORF type:complete len:216 (-),score=25.06 TRINITY_DN13096_c0_g1_i1:159-806(-)